MYTQLLQSHLWFALYTLRKFCDTDILFRSRIQASSVIYAKRRALILSYQFSFTLF